MVTSNYCRWACEIWQRWLITCLYIIRLDTVCNPIIINQAMMQNFEVMFLNFNADIIEQVLNSKNNRSVGAEIHAV
jgi:hypothetical protein